VVGDVRSQRLGAESIPAFYMSIQRFTYGPQALVVRAKRDAPALVATLRQVIRRIDPTVPVFEVRTMNHVRAASLQQERLLIALVGSFAGTALLLSALGTYGVIAFTVQQRTSEIGVRIALGAQGRDVLSLVLRQGAKLAGLGLLVGLAGAFAATRVLSSVLYETAPSDTLSYLVAILALLVASWLALLVPARRAMRVDPLVALRSE
jgi:putative ABC transport system permease protein